jgi:UPF0755 protein
MKIKSKFTLLVFLGIVFSVLSFYYSIFTPTNNFPVNKIFIIEKGQSSDVIIENLKKDKFIDSIFYAKILSRFTGLNLKAGEYFWEKPMSTLQILSGVNAKQKIYKVTIPEGYTKLQIADKIENLNLKNFNKKIFLENGIEGYLFPDTYIFPSFVTTDEILKEFKENFENKTKQKFGQIPDKKDVIVASILEREARTIESMKLVSGILKNRLEINMPLQVDASVLYGQGAWKDRVYFKDLKSDSEYNTYENTGLPPGAISNPGLKSLEAAMFPIENSYIYYLTGSDNKMHYAKTFPEHVDNRKFLR